MKTIKISITFWILFSTLFTSAQTSLEGKWKTVDDITGETTSVVEIYTQEGRLFGKIDQLFNEEDKESVCTNCKGKDKDKPIIGLNILKSLKRSGNIYKGGKIFDPSNGKEYRCKIWLDEK